MNHIHRSIIVDAPFSSVIEYTAEFFKENVSLRVKAVASTTAPVETRYELASDKTDAARRHDALALSWHAWSPLFPSFSGWLTVRPHSAHSMLGLDGTYEPPGGWFGRLFDRAIGERLAHGTMDQLLERLRGYIERRFLEFRQMQPSVEELNARDRISK